MSDQFHALTRSQDQTFKVHQKMIDNSLVKKNLKLNKNIITIQKKFKKLKP